MPRAHVTGIDNEQNLRIESEWLEEESGRLGTAGRVHLSRADARSLPFPDEAFGVVTCVSTLEHIEGEGDIAAMSEIARVTRRGGLIALTVPTHVRLIEQPTSPGVPYFERRYDAQSLRDRLCSQPGLEVVGIRCFTERLWHHSAVYLRQRSRYMALCHRGPLWRPVRWMLLAALALTPVFSRLCLRDWTQSLDEEISEPGGAVIALRRES
jgi:SAM-dependent methyltransferase